MKKIFRYFISYMLFGIIFFMPGFSGRTAFASRPAQYDCPVDYIWREIRSDRFVILYTVSQVSLADEIHTRTISQLESDLTKYIQAFSAEIPTPITIRIYPSELEYYCLNAFAPLISSFDSHSHIGTREIALIDKGINANLSNWNQMAINALRHELAVLFGELVSNGNAPPGLLQGLGGYFEDPGDTFIGRFQATGEITEPERSWQRLWEEDVSVSDPVAVLQQTSIIAYLVDVFGWEKLVLFFQKSAELQGYRQAIVEVYGFSLQDLQTHWTTYFPIYVQTRWQANVIHNYDLSQYQVLISEGAYTDAARKLTEALPLIDLFGGSDKLIEAESLLKLASLGMQAADQTLLSRQAILGNDYKTGLEHSQQALAMYQQLGDPRRIAELELYQNICNEVLSLRLEMDQLRGVGTPLDPVRTNRIISIGRRLNELGDAQGANEVQIALLLLGAGQQVLVQWVTVIGLFFCIFFIWRRFVQIRKYQTSRINLL